MKTLLKGTLGLIYLLRAKRLFFVEFILTTEDFCLRVAHYIPRQVYKVYKVCSLHVQQNVNI